MKNSSKRFLSLILAVTLAVGLCVAAPLTAAAGSSQITRPETSRPNMEIDSTLKNPNLQQFATTTQDGPFKVTHPIGAIYYLNETATPLRARFEYDNDAGLGRVNALAPIKVQWYWSASNSNTNRTNGLGESTVAYADKIDHTATHTPATDVLGVKYYYAVLTYEEALPRIYSAPLGIIAYAPTVTDQPTRIEVVTKPARIEVVAREKNFQVKKTDEDGKVLPGAVLLLAPQDGGDEQDVLARTQEKTTGADGFAEFAAAEGEYLLTEKKAPEGYEATDDEYVITISADGVYIFAPGTQDSVPFDGLTIVNKKNPATPTPTPNLAATPTPTPNLAATPTPIPAVTLTPTPPAPPGGGAQSFDVNKTDGDGKPLSGAILSLVPDSDYEQDATTVKASDATVANGSVKFTVAPGYYILSEKQAPAGYNATDEKYYILVTGSGVYIIDPATKAQSQYSAVTFVNKAIPKLEKDDHFAFMQGYPEGDFRPDNNMSRAEAVVMFSRLLSESMNMAADYRNDYYPDVPAAEWYANQVGYMQRLGVLADYSRDGRFRPDEPVTRAEFATLAAHFDNLEPAESNNFSDVANSHWAVKYINSAAAKGWITGYPDGTFKPEDNITRAEVVTLVGRMLDRYADGAYLTANASSLPRHYSDLTTTYWGYLMIMEASTGHDYTRDSIGEHWTTVYK